MSTEKRSGSPRPLKRDFEESFGLETPFHVDSSQQSEPENHASQPNSPLPPKESATNSTSLPTPPVSIQSTKRAASPAISTTSSLSSLDSSTLSARDGSPLAGTAFAALNGDGSKAPPPKKPKLTFAEKEARRMEKLFRDEEKAREREKKEAKKQAQLEEKRKRDMEKDEEKRRKDVEKEVERQKKEAERLIKEEQKKVRDEAKRKKEEEKLRIEEEKRKKAASQKTLVSFFGTPSKKTRDMSSASPPPPGSASGITTKLALATPIKKERSAYDKMFPDFFLQNNVTLAPISRFERDGEAAKVLETSIDAYISGSRSPGRKRDFDARELFHLMDTRLVPRGKSYTPVRDIVADIFGDPSRPIDLTTDSQNSQIKRTKDMLKDIPMKFLKFPEDVRPPYQGTYTKTPINGVAKLARNPMRRDLPKTDYDYDSEAEWIEDEDAEDLNSEGEEDEEGADDVEDMDGFLDDENDDLVNSRRMVVQSDLEPISTGLCWEDRKKRNTYVKMMPFRMEFILDPAMKSIDPFSSTYWEPIPFMTTTLVTGSMDPPRLPLNSIKASSSNIQLSSPNASKTLFTPASSLATSQIPSSSTSAPTPTPKSASTKTNNKPVKLVDEADLTAFKKAIEGSDLSKLGIIEVLKKKFPRATGKSIKDTLDLVAVRVGGRESEKRWVLRE